MKIAKFNLEIRSSATYRRTLTWLDSKKRPINMTGMTVRIEIRERVGSGILLDLTEANGRLSVSPTLGKINIYLSPADTAGLTISRGVWDLRVTLANGDIRYIAEGSVIVTPSVTV